MSLLCSKDHCTKDATKEIRFSLAVNGNHEPSISSPVLFLCEEHKDIFTEEDCFGPAQWASICNGFTRMGKQAPTREFSKIIVQDITKPLNDPHKTN